MKTVCASSVLFGKEAFESLGEVVVLPDARISNADLRDATALVIRSKTDVTPELLKDTKVAFVGTATAGFDHMDTAWLESAGVAWYAAAGCNANSVAEYITAALLHLNRTKGVALAGKTLGVIGVGQVGIRVVKKAGALGLRVLKNDPPLQLATGDDSFVSLDQLLREADIITLHVPLTSQGPFPTFHMADSRFFAKAKPGVVFLNASRGEVMDTESVLLSLEHGVISHAVLDVWENEPDISLELLGKAVLGTPHIAGYSFEGRLNGTVQVYRELCRFLEQEPQWKPEESRLPKPASMSVKAAGRGVEEVFQEMVAAAYDITADDRALRAGTATIGPHFNALRKNYPEHREFPAAALRLSGASDELLRAVISLGFQPQPG